MIPPSEKPCAPFSDCYFPQVQVLQAADGQEAVTMALDLHPDLILLDGSMPGMNGYQVAEVLRTMPRTRAIPLIAISAEGSESLIGVRLRTLCNLFLPKPLSIDTLRAAIDSHLTSELAGSSLSFQPV